MASIVYDIKDHVMTVTLNRPQVRNAWNAELAQGLHNAWLRLEADEQIRVCVVTANGGFFSAGMDLKDPPRDLATLAMPNLSVPCNKPIIVAAEGFAIGYASVFCLLADMVFAGRNTYFLYPEAKMGLFQGMMGGFPGRLQYKAGLQWLMTADQMSAARACEIGLVNEVVEDGKAYERAMEVAGKIARNAPLVVQAMKAVALGTVTKGPVEKNFHHNRMIARVMSSEDGKEGFASFKEKRSAKFSGK
jgi:enoyl-CoA hydratase